MPGVRVPSEVYGNVTTIQLLLQHFNIYAKSYERFPAILAVQSLYRSQQLRVLKLKFMDKLLRSDTQSVKWRSMSGSFRGCTYWAEWSMSSFRKGFCKDGDELSSSTAARTFLIE